MKSLQSYSGITVKLPTDILLTVAVFMASYWSAARYGFPRDLALGSPPIEGYWLAGAIIALGFLVSARVFQLYRPRRAGSNLELALDLARVHFHLALITFAVGFYFRSFSYSRIIITTFFAVNPIVLFVHHSLWLARERRLFMRGVGTRPTLVVGVGPLAEGIARRIRKHPWTGLNVVGFVDTELAKAPDDEGAIADDETRVVADHQVLGTLTNLESIVDAHHIQEVIVALPFRSLGLIGEIDQLLVRSVVGLRTVLDLDAFNTLSREISDFDGVQVINLRGIRTYGAHAFVKRALDVILSAAILVVLSPLLAAIAALIRVTSGSPIIYRQERVGLDGSVFQMLKFRTMRNDAEGESGPVWADTDDQRCIPGGKFLRRTSLDELPQLLNVFLGHMSLVGPRPERPVFIDQFRRTVPQYMLRLRGKAGLTGWAQVNGWRGKTSLSTRIQYDLYYLKNWTIWLDFKILLLTLLRGWRNQAEHR